MTPGEEFQAEFEKEFETPAFETRRQVDQICGTLDLIADLQAAVERDGITVEGSRGHLAVHPAIPEIRQQRIALGRLLSQLGLPAEKSASRVARRAAEARWSK